MAICILRHSVRAANKIYDTPELFRNLNRQNDHCSLRVKHLIGVT